MYFKHIENGYITMFGQGKGAVTITKEEYDVLKETVRNRPTAPDGFDYRLREDLTWELYELPVAEVDPDPEITDTEALEILLGGVL